MRPSEACPGAAWAGVALQAELLRERVVQGATAGAMGCEESPGARYPCGIVGVPRGLVGRGQRPTARTLTLTAAPEGKPVEAQWGPTRHEP